MYDLQVCQSGWLITLTLAGFLITFKNTTKIVSYLYFSHSVPPSEEVPKPHWSSPAGS